ncbi:hypothetical protein OXYTRIMIC_450 [Oxytricha trifallax]|uniref:Uncharacterized protein n=1 Tax=Oxytricha trifallax TaxID=1172189 RepID=A0A073HZZ7_9SPIT|nr:hypothetical protein OXYTRIMIC_450 [Oxytricha trifallax]
MLTLFNFYIDNCDELVLRRAPQISYEKDDLEYEGKFSKFIGEVSEVENYMFNSRQHLYDIVNDDEQKRNIKIKDEGMKGNAKIRSKGKKEGKERSDNKENRINQEKNVLDKSRNRNKYYTLNMRYC